ncbi:hypothetical protein BO94DRAFT_357097 [Aspergillus sclerotioniger CBS 115572]|uniref:Zn(2)-C6 fungal-type domain-containing protein n=1 Tax=Aspergillus sclerotioniger CBS 115572 TaxID=1450535 RepID=A0A317UXK7_9EURO|nr:hypothetical protein BO94DRAFT_357097 [Aspergillus sclerotioniger CBS 115572]PWY64730.1 hypothetical protein BO94DRAFT_357097 [Aspergillus sclerotioniger CBS 115572]
MTRTQLYGRACLQCSKSKCKCISRPDGQGCERCYRMNRSCQPGTSTRTLHAQRNNTVARISQLEGKIDSLVFQLGARDSNASSETSQRPAISSSSSLSGEAASASASTSYVFECSPESLHIFQDQMLKYFPFLHIPRDVQWLHQERPFLSLCIMMVTSRSTQTKIELGEKIRKIATERIYLSTEPGAVNIDLLLGLLTFIAWAHDHLLHNCAGSLSRATQLAMTVVFDLRLNKPLPEDSNMLPVGVDRTCASLNVATRTLEERRAVLACFLMNSIVSSYLAQLDPMQWTPHMDECLEFLTQNAESPHDEVLAHQIRLQRIASEMENIRSSSEPVPLAFYLAALRRKVNEVKEGISPELRQNGIIGASIYYTELSLFGLIRNIKEDLPDLQRLDALHGCLHTAKSAIDRFFEIPVVEYYGISFPFFGYLARSIVVLFRLSILNDPVWDTGLMRSTVDVLQVMDRLISNLQQARAAAGEEAAGGHLDSSTRKFRLIRSTCAAKLAEHEQKNRTAFQTARENDLQLNSLLLDYGLLDESLTSGLLEGTQFLDGLLW